LGEGVAPLIIGSEIRTRSTSGLILAAPASGSGKTMLTLGLLRAFRRRGIAVAGAKTGPDYIDPRFHEAACGTPSINLDPWAMRQHVLAGLIAGIEAALVLCEGVMGLFDGTGPDGETGSTADLASASCWPIVLIVDAEGQSASVAALLRGFATHRPGLAPAGVIFNRVGSTRHAAMLASAVGRHLPQLRMLGAVPRLDVLALPSRHLGLVQAEELAGLDRTLDAAADAVEAGLDLDALAALARPSVWTGAAAPEILPPLGQRIAIARDQAFAFAYPHLLQSWQRAGASILPFSPLADEAPARDADAVFLPGGYPELHAGRLAAATGFQTGLRGAARRSLPIYGECGGYMALGRALIDGSGQAHQMAGLLPVVTSFAQPRRHLGYRQLGILAGPWAGLAARGHEFHFAAETEADPGTTRAPPLLACRDAAERDLGTAGAVCGSVSGSFLHLIDQVER
jgi:cobyrinic acid a,c-diamide synthase